eukprot:gb/GECG01003542.1/.p1 GENE.gb/GECG01003542.1/~~gb/GECG01003542.1/.p1  ORF type:complete len:1029 (+),score=116.51 gb/GECG01003542.1/:1-3087(+)
MMNGDTGNPYGNAVTTSDPRHDFASLRERSRMGISRHYQSSTGGDAQSQTSHGYGGGQSTSMVPADQTNGGGAFKRAHVEPPLGMVLKESEKLAGTAGVAGVDAATRMKAQRTLGAAFDIDSDPLVDMDVPVTTEETEDDKDERIAPEVDVDRYLHQQEDDLIYSTMEEAKNIISTATDRRMEQFLAEDWEMKKREILTILELNAPTQPTAHRQDFAASQRRYSVHGSTGRMDGTSKTIAPECRHFCDTLADSFRMGGELGKEPWLATFKGAAKAALSTAGFRVNEMKPWFRPWNLLQHIAREGMRGHGSVSEAHYRDAHHTQDSEFGRFIAAGSLCYLESSYSVIMERRIQGNRTSDRGGSVDRLEDVRAFLQVKFNNSPDVQGSLYAQLYYCLRSGAYREAISLADANRQTLSPDFTTALRTCCNVVEAAQREPWTNNICRSLSGAASRPNITQESIRALSRVQREYDQKHGTMDDPFKKALWRLVANVHPAKHDSDADSRYSVVNGYQDFLWQRLWHVVVDLVLTLGESWHEGVSPNGYDLNMLGGEVVGITPDVWDPNGHHPYQYFEILCLVGQFELGLDYLSRNGANENPHTHLEDTVHYSLALYHYGLLRVHSPKRGGSSSNPGESDILLQKLEREVPINTNPDVPETYDEDISTGRCLYYLDLPTLLKVYVHHRLGGDAEMGVRYFAMLRGISSDKELDARKRLIVDLLVAHASAAHDKVLGSLVSSDAARLVPKNGLLHELQDIPFFRFSRSGVRTILSSLFHRLREQNRMEEACDMLLRSYDVGSALEVIIAQLGQYMDVMKGDQTRQFWVQRAFQVRESFLSETAIGGTTITPGDTPRQRVSTVSEQEIDSVSRAYGITSENAKALLLSQKKIRSGFTFTDTLRYCSIMIEMCQFFDMLFERQFKQAMALLDSLQIIPSEAACREERLPYDLWEEYFVPLHPLLKDSYYKALLGAVECLLQLEKEASIEARRTQRPADPISMLRERRRILGTADHHPVLQRHLTTDQVNQLHEYEMQL